MQVQFDAQTIEHTDDLIRLNYFHCLSTSHNFMGDSQKEKIQLFTQITECIHSSTLRVNVSYLNHVGTAISILLMFCEELDADVRVR